LFGEGPSRTQTTQNQTVSGGKRKRGHPKNHIRIERKKSTVRNVQGEEDWIHLRQKVLHKIPDDVKP